MEPQDLQDCTKVLAENARLTEELRLAQAAARAAREELQGFVYAASHDVKEALRSVNSYSQLLVRHAPPGPELSEYGSFVTLGIRNAIAILDRMNMFARVDPAPRRSSMNLAVPVQMALLKLDSAIREAGTRVTYDSLHEVNANEMQLQLMFENYLDNALKYGKAESRRIEIVSEEADEGVVVSVRDNGPGIAPEYQQTVFQPFKRLHSKEIPGIGLGLAICAKIALAHGGRVWVESDGVSGSEFKTLLSY